MKTENEIAKMVLDAAFKIHTNLGPGLLESVYEAVLAYELAKGGVTVCRQVPIPIRYEAKIFDEGFRADLLVGECVIVELKSVERLAPVHGKQVLTQLRLSGHRLGLLSILVRFTLKMASSALPMACSIDPNFAPLASFA